MLILASQSPRRKEILESKLGKDSFLIIPSDIDEDIDLPPYLLPMELAYLKAKKIFDEHLDATVIGSDTIVVVDDEILGKPKDEEDAFKMLKELSGRSHKVISGYCVISKERVIKGTVTTIVNFNELSDDLIRAYIKTGSPMDKAGSYGIQDTEFNLVRSIEGDYNNVVGLPIDAIMTSL